MTTPFDRDGELVLKEVAAQVEWLIKAGSHGIAAGGSTGEGHTLDHEEYRDLLAASVEAASGRIPVIAGIWPLVSYRNAEFLANEVPGVVVPKSVLKRMERITDKDAAREEGLAIARETLLEVRDVVQGVQVSAPFGRVQYALDVFSVL